MAEHKKTAGIISPSISLSGKKDFSAGLKYLEEQGYNLILGKQLENSFFSENTEKQRATDIMDMFCNPDVDIIFCTSGGAGSQRLLPYLDFSTIKNNPKPIVGHSDNTALQLGIYSQTGNVYISGFSLDYDFRTSSVSDMVATSFEAITKSAPISFQSGKTLNKGQSQGILIGDCLSMVCDLCGTKYFPDLEGKILVLEDECEKPYKIDRLLTTIKQHPQFDKISGIIFGQFTDCDSANSTYGKINDVLHIFAKQAPFPIIYDFPFGHIKDKYVLPMGKHFYMDADKQFLEKLTD